MARALNADGDLDLDLEDLPAPARWREWMGRVEAVIFASAEPALRENLARVVGNGADGRRRRGRRRCGVTIDDEDGRQSLALSARYPSPQCRVGTLAKVGVEGSNPFARSNFSQQECRLTKRPSG